MEEIKKEFIQTIWKSKNSDEVWEWIESKFKQHYIQGSNDCYKSFPHERVVDEMFAEKEVIKIFKEYMSSQFQNNVFGYTDEAIQGHTNNFTEMLKDSKHSL